MFDFQLFSLQAKEHYYKLFRKYDQMEKTRQFIGRWLAFVYSYTRTKGFIAFDPPSPLLNRLNPRAKSVILVRYSYTRVPRLPRYASVFPLYPFRIRQEHTDTVGEMGLEFLQYYLDMTGIRVIGFYDMERKEDEIMLQLREKYPDIRMYGSASYYPFCRVVTSLNSRPHGSGYRFRPSVSEDKVSRLADL